MNRKILQIIPASAPTIARFTREDGTIDAYPIICWALVEDEMDGDEPPLQLVVGMIIEGPFRSLAAIDEDGAGQFIGYGYGKGTPA